MADTRIRGSRRVAFTLQPCMTFNRSTAAGLLAASILCCSRGTAVAGGAYANNNEDVPFTSTVSVVSQSVRRSLAGLLEEPTGDMSSSAVLVVPRGARQQIVRAHAQPNIARGEPPASTRKPPATQVRQPPAPDPLSRIERTSQAEAIVMTRMCVAVLCGAIVGIERKAASATAGVRTLSLVSLGSAIFTLTSTFGIGGGGGAARMGAAVSTGVGFLGAGAINRTGNGNRNLTTSASIWIAASLGLAAASGMYRLALLGAVFTVFILRWSMLLRYFRLVLRRQSIRLSTFIRGKVGRRLSNADTPESGRSEAGP